MASHPVARVGEIPSGGRKIVEVAARSIEIFNVDREYFALRNSCPHQGGPLCEGQVSPPSPRAGRANTSTAGRVTPCAAPWHAWEFDIRTTRCARA